MNCGENEWSFTAGSLAPTDRPGYAALRLYGFTALRLYGFTALRLYGFTALRLYGFTANKFCIANRNVKPYSRLPE
jgi:hypothetical protein